jgi:hypothetical protein
VTRRLLIIGNSHVAALRSAVTPGQGAIWRGWTVDFAAVPTAQLPGLTVTKGLLRTTNDATRTALRTLCGKVRFALDDYAAIAVTGGLLAPHALIDLHAAARWSGLPSAAGSALPETLALISEGAALAAATGAAQDRPLFPLLQALAAAAPGRVAVLQQPRLAEAACSPAAAMPRVAAAIRAGDGAALSDLYDQASLAAYAALAQVILQPPVTRGCPFLTAPDYTRGALRLAAGAAQPAGDVLHGNAAYGTAVLTALDAAFADRPGP